MNASIIDLATVATFAPAAISSTSSPKVKENYKHYNTADLIEVMEKQGFHPVHASQVKVRKNAEERKHFAKHAIVFRDSKVNEENGTAAQVVIVNSHDGTSSYRLYFGLYRFVCANGLMVGSEFASKRVCHKGNKNTAEEIAKISREFAEKAGEVNKQIEKWNGIQLSKEQQIDFAKKAMLRKWGESKAKESYKPEDFLEAHNVEDSNNNSLWSVFNKVQENMLKGGVQGQNSRGRFVCTRAVKNINKNIDMNKYLWNLAEEYAD